MAQTTQIIYNEMNTEESIFGGNNMKKRTVLIGVLGIAIGAAAVYTLVGAEKTSKIGRENTITISQLEKAINISRLSTAEFVYNGVAEKYKEGSTEKVDCHIAYDASVKVGIDMEDVTFEIDEEAKTVTPILPEIVVNIATIDEGAISYIPKNPDVALKDIITICKEDAMREANESEKLYDTAEENLKAALEALLMPILDAADYTILWTEEL